MTVTAKVLIPAKVAETAQTTQYTATNCRAIVDKFTATNTSAGNLTITVNLVASGGTASAANTITKARAVAPNEAYTFPELVGQVLENGGMISTIASGAGLTMTAAGREIT